MKNENLCSYYCLWCTHHRREILAGLVSGRLDALIRQQAAAIGGRVDSLSILPDHVAMVISVGQSTEIQKAIRSIKLFTAITINQEFPALRGMYKSIWTKNYLLRTLGELPNQECVDGFIQAQAASDKRNPVS